MKLNRKTLIAAALGIVALGGIALAQIVTLPTVSTIYATDLFQDISTGVPRQTNVYASALQLQGWILGGNIVRSSEKPVLTGCITGGGTIAGSDSAFILTGGTTASTSCIATFPTAYVSTPVCSVTSQTAYGTTTPSYTVSTTAVTITQASLSSEVYNVICVAQPGG